MPTMEGSARMGSLRSESPKNLKVVPTVSPKNLKVVPVLSPKSESQRISKVVPVLSPKSESQKISTVVPALSPKGESQKILKVVPALEELETFGSYSSHSILASRNQLFPNKSFPPGAIDPIVRMSLKKTQMSSGGSLKLDDLKTPAISLPLSFEDTVAEALTSADDETSATLALRLEAMTWAAMAKDTTILTLQQRLKVALVSLQSQQDMNAQLGYELHSSLKENDLVQAELSRVRKERADLESTAETLSAQVRKLEAEALEQKRRIDSRLELLSERVPFSPRGA